MRGRQSGRKKNFIEIIAPLQSQGGRWRGWACASLHPSYAKEGFAGLPFGLLKTKLSFL